MNRIWKSILILLMTFLTSGCSTRTSSVTTVTFWHAMGGPLGHALQELIDEFNEEHPSIEVESISMGNYNALSQKIMAGVLSHRIPTIAQVYSSWTTNLYESDVLSPLEDYIDGEDGFSKKELSDFYSIFIQDNTVNGELISLPFNKSVYAYYYNKDIFLENGIDSFPGKWSSLLQAAKKLQKDSESVTALGVSVGMFESILYAFGGRMLDENQEPDFFSKEGIRALQFLKDLLYRFNLAHLTTGFQHQDEFIAEKILFIVGTSVSYSFIMKSKPEFDVGIAPMPWEDTAGVMVMGTNIALFKDKPEKEKKAAWKFIKWFVAPEQQARWAMNTGYVPVRRSAERFKEVKAYFKKVPGLRRVWNQLNYAKLESSDPSWLYGRKIFSQVALEPVLRGKMDVKERLKIAEEEVKKILER